MRMIRLQLMFAVVLCIAWNVCAAKELTVVTSTGSTNVRCALHEGVWYAPLNDLANAMQEKTYYRDTASSVAINGYAFECTPGNPFVKVTDARRVLHVYQFSFAPFRENGIVYVPTAQFVDILILATPFDIQFDRDNYTVNISSGRERAPQPVSVSSVAIEGRTNGFEINITFEKTVPPDIRAELSEVHNVNVHLPPFTFDSAHLSYASDDVKDEVTLDSTGREMLYFSLNGEASGISGIKKNNVYTVLIRAKRNTASAKAAKKTAHDKWKLDVIVLDAGHGGKDPGAQGVYGTNEKDVALGVVLKLGKLLENAGFKVVYTRKTDTFVELSRRGQIANEAKGKLFICIHCNSMPTKPNPANGIESYILRPGKTETAARVAARENSVVKLE
ncbi:MAG TPA: N-acetylmuramoyl-L-alanine amidase, partial [Candidatus Kapabacteria bacterium]|nr:N-acetylmuramoyl-L-alanine amidase [Candidatus Kapabacteria bacterium]